MDASDTTVSQVVPSLVLPTVTVSAPQVAGSPSGKSISSGPVLWWSGDDVAADTASSPKLQPAVAAAAPPTLLTGAPQSLPLGTRSDSQLLSSSSAPGPEQPVVISTAAQQQPPRTPSVAAASQSPAALQPYQDDVHVSLSEASRVPLPQLRNVRDVCGRVLVIGYARVVAQICKVLKAGRVDFVEEQSSVRPLIDQEAATFSVPFVDDAEADGGRIFHPCLSAVPLTAEELRKPACWGKDVWSPRLALFSTVFLAIACGERLLLEPYLPLLDHFRMLRLRTVLVVEGKDEGFRPGERQLYANYLLHRAKPDFCKELLGYPATPPDERLRPVPPQLVPQGNALVSWFVGGCSAHQVSGVRRIVLNHVTITGFELTLPAYVPTARRRDAIDEAYYEEPQDKSMFKGIFKGRHG